MARAYNQISINILKYLAQNKSGSMEEIKTVVAPKLDNKDFYNSLFRLKQQDLVDKTGSKFLLTADGTSLLARLSPERDGVWKMVVFDIPEKQKNVRIILRAKLKQLNFKKWQNSIWVTPYKLDESIEKELAALGKSFFVRLIKVGSISQDKDLEKLFM